MRARGLVTVVVLAALTACSPAGESDDGRAAAVPQPTNVITVGGVERSYIVQAPDDALTAMPLLIMLHGAGGDGVRAEQVTGFTDAALAAQFVVAYPDGTRANTVAPWFVRTPLTETLITQPDLLQKCSGPRPARPYR